jgi:hypothetical protein
MTNGQSNARETTMRQLEQQRRCDKPAYVKDALRRLSDAGYGDEAILEICV